MSSTRRLVDQVVSELHRCGVDQVFGVGGANIEDLYDALHASTGGAEPVRPIVAKHEFSAATMADGYARTTGRLGVVAATSGGGAMNLIPGLAEAYASRISVLALVGQPPVDQEGQGAFQDSSGKAGSFDARQVFSAVSRFCAKVEDASQIGPLLRQAIAAAQSDPRGPAVLLLPKDVQQALVHRPARPALFPPTPTPTPQPEPDRSAYQLAREQLGAGGTVLIIAGEGVASANARVELDQVARRLGAWVAVTPDAKDVFSNHDQRFVGVAGVMGHANVEDCLRRADVCLLVGTRLPAMSRGGLDQLLAGTAVVCVDPEPPFVAGTALTGPVRGILREIITWLDPGSHPAPEHGGPIPLPPPKGAQSFSYASAVAAIESALPPDAHVFVDAGNTGANAIHLLPAPGSGRFVVAVGMGGMGYTFGAGIGAALGTGRRTYVLAGDGAFYMHGSEVHTALEYHAPVTFVIFNNNAHAMCVTREHLFTDDSYSLNLFRRAELAAGLAAGLPALEVTKATSADQLRRALLHSNITAGPAFVELDLDPHELPPFLPFLAAAERKSVETKEIYR